MCNQSIYRLLVVLSLLTFSVGASVSAADNSTEAVTSSVQASAKVNINTASNMQLASLKGLGDKKAQAIVDYRNANGEFTSLEQLVDVKGIGQSTLDKLQPFISL